ncbi:DUF4919 domain-containing protein [Chitinophaga sp. SYP-B3965]|uniref:DUF4919 domain-containing protein n=1 Tax=Chitinophaga sp. SYP-B3965 TaxID=2663120 RepID=UPI001564F623|nr:DUF4919 domain-containing protein [Chitinophaga sp. SYP-B3965]
MKCNSLIIALSMFAFSASMAQAGRTTSTDSLGNRYSGMMKNNQKNGTGELTYTNGNRYEGEFKNDLKEGQGKMIFQNGRVVSGIWKADYFFAGTDRAPGQDSAWFVADYTDGKREPVVLFITKENIRQSIVVIGDSAQTTEVQDALIAKKQSFTQVRLNEYKNELDTQKVVLFKNPVKFYEKGSLVYYDAFRFTPTKEGMLFWSFNNIKKQKSWFIITDKEGRYFTDYKDPASPRFPNFLTNNEKGLIYQQSHKPLVPGKEYLIWFSTDPENIKPNGPGINFNITLNIVNEETGRKGLKNFFEPKNLYTLFPLKEKGSNAYLAAFKHIQALSADPASPIYYPNLAKRFIHYDPELTDTEMVGLLVGFSNTQGFVDHPNYSDSLKMIVAMVDAGQWAEAKKTGEQLTEVYPVYLSLLEQMFDIYKQLNMEEEKTNCAKKIMRIIDAMSCTGDGTAENPIFQLEGADDGYYLSFKKLRSLRNNGSVDVAAGLTNGMRLNLIKCVDKDEYKRDIYFFVDHLVARNRFYGSQK